MQNDDANNIETLLKLGLSKLQAEVYLALTKLGEVPVKKIAEDTKIDRAHVYQVISKLQQIGLVKKILSNPACFRAISLREGAQILLERKTREMDSIEKVIQNMPKTCMEEPTDLESQFILIPGKETHIREFDKIMKRCSRTFDNVFPCQKDFFKLLLIKKGKDDIYMNHFLKNHIKVRTILCSQDNEKPPRKAREIIERIKKGGNIEVKHTNLCSAAMFAILDDKELYMHVGEGPEWKEKPGLYSNNPCLVGMAKGYFEQLWQTCENDL